MKFLVDLTWSGKATIVSKLSKELKTTNKTAALTKQLKIYGFLLLIQLSITYTRVIYSASYFSKVKKLLELCVICASFDN